MNHFPADWQKFQEEEDACERSGAWSRINSATSLGAYGDGIALLDLAEQREAISLLWRCRLISVGEVNSIADRYVLAAERAKSNLRKALA